ncbi:hypothetical protein CDAR_293191 [Caerostris darwini]|uniref:DUF4258 domain-containing protein n=1 Tax=Caerostris darwini TaxID=1538125 RepID=A0AAV4QG17_9ARAC|nr:hypothetical protein CDAR_293191 [Caerostris darwini]
MFNLSTKEAITNEGMTNLAYPPGNMEFSRVDGREKKFILCRMNAVEKFRMERVWAVLLDENFVLVIIYPNRKGAHRLKE